MKTMRIMTVVAILLFLTTSLSSAAQQSSNTAQKLRVVQWGITHSHANGKIKSLQLLPEQYEVIGYVDDRPAKSACYSEPEMKRYEGIRKMTPEEVLSRKDIDLVVVEVSNAELVDVALKCAQRGLPMHLDKPAGETLAPFREVVDLCREKNLPLQMGYMLRGNPALNYILEIIEKGWLGEIYSIDANMSLGYGGEKFQNYLRQYDGGMMFLLGCHLIDYAISVMGDKEPTKVNSVMKSAPGDPEDLHNCCECTIEWEHAIATLHAHGRAGKSGTDLRCIRIDGTNGTVIVNPLERAGSKEELKMELYLNEARGEYKEGRNLINFGLQGDRYTVQLTELAEIIRGERENPVHWYKHDILTHKTILQACGFKAE